ncbi:MAG: hypothetical protein GY942_15485, partial [Aestuariibacter sp.]|nr:hypothetical protein [Aestuariibacter sp.]
EGMMGRSAGFNFQESSHAGDHTTGTAEETTTYLVNGAAESGAAITVDTGATTFLIGDVITFAGVNRVHPETKLDTGELQKFVITADSGATATSLAIDPPLTATGGSQNVTAVPANNAAVVKVGAGANELLSGSLAYHRDAFALGTADLELPQGVHFASREVFDGISLRIVKQYDINEDRFPCRTDVLYGYKSLRPQLACRIHADG